MKNSYNNEFEVGDGLSLMSYYILVNNKFSKSDAATLTKRIIYNLI